MIKITIHKDKDNITGFEAIGHANSRKDEELYDLLCNSVSVSMQQTVIGLNLFLNEASFELESYESGHLKCSIRYPDLSRSVKEKIKAICDTMILFLEQLQEQYKENININYKS